MYVAWGTVNDKSSLIQEDVLGPNGWQTIIWTYDAIV